MDSETPVVTFQYDDRDRLIHETRVVNGSATVYDLWYTYDGLGNRLERRDESASPRTKTTYFYDSDPANRDPNYPTNNNRLMRYEESVDNGQGGWTLTRTVRYVYYITGHASNIIVKDVYRGQGNPADYEWYRGLALYYTSAGKLWRAVWERWMQDAYGNVIPGTYSREKGREFYYDGPRQRYLSRAMDVSDENPDNWKPTPEPQLWTDYLGDDPYADFTVTETWNEPLQRWEIAPPTEKLGYLAGYGAQAQQDAQTGATRYLHGDLIRSTMLTTNEGGTAVSAVSYTAFGEPVGDPESLGTRYRYAGGWGYEDDLLRLDGAQDTKPIVLLHVGWRWYDPALGRFIQRDRIGLRGGANLYGYATNNPSVAADPTGLDYDPVLGDPFPGEGFFKNPITQGAGVVISGVGACVVKAAPVPGTIIIVGGIILWGGGQVYDAAHCIDDWRPPGPCGPPVPTNGPRVPAGAWDCRRGIYEPPLREPGPKPRY